MLLIDSETYDRFARRILQGDFRGEDIYSVNVLYPYVLAGIYALAKGSIFAVLALQAVIDSASCVLAWWIGRKLFTPAVGLIAGIAAALYGPMIFYSGALLTPTLITFLGLVTLALLVKYQDRPRARVALFAGLAIGLATLARGNNALFVVLALAFFLVAAGGRARAIRHWLAFTAAAVALVALVSVRNYMVERRWVPVAANYAAFYIGHNDEATGLYAMPSFIQSARFESEVWGARAAIAKKLGRDVSLAESAQYLFGEGLRFIAAHPGKELSLAGTKLYYFFNRTESPTNLNYYFARDYSALLRWLPLTFGLVAPFALYGMWLSRREWRRLLALHLYVLVGLLTALLFFVSAEYRLAVAPVMMVFAAHGVVVLVSAVRDALGSRSAAPRDTRRSSKARTPREAREARAPGAPLLAHPLVLAVLMLAPLVVACNVRDTRLSMQSLKRVDYLNFGTLYKDKGDLATAKSFFERSLAIDPRYRPAYEALASVAMAEGDRIEAARLARMARGLTAPGETGTEGERGRIADSLLTVAETYRAGDYPTALAGFERLRRRSAALGDQAMTRSIMNNIGLCQWKLGALAAAESVFTAILREDSTYVNAHTNLARVYEAEGRTREAIQRFEAALGIDPQNRSARAGLARLMAAPR